MNKPYRVHVQIGRHHPEGDHLYSDIYRIDLGDFSTESEAVEFVDKLEVAASDQPQRLVARVFGTCDNKAWATIGSVRPGQTAVWNLGPPYFGLKVELVAEDENEAARRASRQEAVGEVVADLEALRVHLAAYISDEAAQHGAGAISTILAKLKEAQA